MANAYRQTHSAPRFAAVEWSPTRILVSCGAVGALSFIATFLIEGATRPGYSAWRHYVSLLATGDGGWMQIANFLVCGSLMLVFAVGLWRTLPSRHQGRQPRR